MKINIFLGDLTDISAKKKELESTRRGSVFHIADTSVRSPLESHMVSAKLQITRERDSAYF